MQIRLCSEYVPLVPPSNDIVLLRSIGSIDYSNFSYDRVTGVASHPIPAGMFAIRQTTWGGLPDGMGGLTKHAIAMRNVHLFAFLRTYGASIFGVDRGGYMCVSVLTGDVQQYPTHWNAGDDAAMDIHHLLDSEFFDRY